MRSILIVDDEQSQRAIIASICAAEGFKVFQAGSTSEALEQIRDHSPDVVITDLRMPGQSGLALVAEIAKMSAPPEVVVMTAYGSVDTAVQAMKLGAYDYLNKPLERDELLLVVQRAAEKRQLRIRGDTLKQELARQLSSSLVARSQAMKDIMAMISRVAQSSSTVLIRGETGTGKERVAKLIHYQSPRAGKPFVAINCAAFPETLLESELFGHEKGAFTGANERKIGMFEAAAEGTIFLDEVADMSLTTQAKVLRVIQEREIRRIGATENVAIDVRIIAATNKNLEKAIADGSFREDLFYRLNVIPIVIPPLRERTEDIGALIDQFLTRSGRTWQATPAALKCLMEYHWPGNVRELEAVMERITVLCPRDIIDIKDLPEEIRGGYSCPAGPAEFIIPPNGIDYNEFEQSILKQALDRCEGNMSKAANLLGMTYRTFQYRVEKYHLK